MDRDKRILAQKYDELVSREERYKQARNAQAFISTALWDLVPLYDAEGGLKDEVLLHTERAWQALEEARKATRREALETDKLVKFTERGDTLR